MSNLKRYANKLHNAVEALFEEFDIHILRAAREEEIDFDALAIFEPFGDFVSFQGEVVVTGADFDLYGFDFDYRRLCLRALLLLLLVVGVLAVVHDLGNRGSSSRSNLNQVEVCLLCLFEGFGEGNNTQVLALSTDNAELRGLNLVVDADLGDAHNKI